MRVSREISLGSSLHRASTDALILKRLLMFSACAKGVRLQINSSL